MPFIVQYIGFHENLHGKYFVVQVNFYVADEAVLRSSIEEVDKIISKKKIESLQIFFYADSVFIEGFSIRLVTCNTLICQDKMLPKMNKRACCIRFGPILRIDNFEAGLDLQSNFLARLDVKDT